MSSPPIAAPLGSAETERLALTPVSAADLDDLVSVFAEPAVWEFPFGRGMDADWTAGFVERAEAHWAEHDFGLWTARTRADHRVIGYLGLSMPAFLGDLVEAERMPAVEVGWRLHPQAWGRGLATEGAHAALVGAFDTLGLAEVCSAPQTINVASVRVAQRLGMSCDGATLLPATADRGAVDVDLHWITRQEWARATPHAADRTR